MKPSSTLLGIALLAITSTLPAQTPDLVDKKAAYEAFKQAGARAGQDEALRNALIQALKGNSDYIRRTWAARELGVKNFDVAVEPLGEAARVDKNKFVREEAIDALGAIASPAAAAGLAQVLAATTDAKLMGRAAVVLGRIGTPEAFRALDSALTNPATKAAAADALLTTDLRNKPQQTAAGLSITLIGIKRTNKYEDGFRTYTARKGAEIAIVYFQLHSAQPVSEKPLLISLKDAAGKGFGRVEGYAINMFSIGADLRPVNQGIAFGIPAGMKPATIDIMGAVFKAEPFWQ